MDKEEFGDEHGEASYERQETGDKGKETKNERPEENYEFKITNYEQSKGVFDTGNETLTALGDIETGVKGKQNVREELTSLKENVSIAGGILPTMTDATVIEATVMGKKAAAASVDPQAAGVPSRLQSFAA